MVAPRFHFCGRHLPRALSHSCAVRARIYQTLSSGLLAHVPVTARHQHPACMAAQQTRLAAYQTAEKELGLYTLKMKCFISKKWSPPKRTPCQWSAKVAKT